MYMHKGEEAGHEAATSWDGCPSKVASLCPCSDYLWCQLVAMYICSLRHCHVGSSMWRAWEHGQDYRLVASQCIRMAGLV